MIKKIGFVGLLIILLLGGCKTDDVKENVFQQIKERGKLVAITGYNAYSYFIYRGQPMGFEYELVKLLTDHLNVDVEIVVVKSLDRMFEMLDNKEGDMIAFNLTVTRERKERVAFTNELNTTNQVLVQRKPENWRFVSQNSIQDSIITSPLDLEGKTIVVRKGSSYIERLENLSDEIGSEIIIKEAEEDLTTENLIQMVADGEIDYTISDENIARLNQSYFPNIDISVDISLPQKIAWAVRKNSNQLLDSINTWIEDVQSQSDYYVIYNKYYKNRTSYKRRVKSPFFSNIGGKLSKYDDLLKEYSQKLDWDWRLLAAQIYEESQFDPRAKSWAGAVGLMQLMPATARDLGVKDLEDPYESLKGGVDYLKFLNDFWRKEVKDKDERIKFVLASYNVGFGHIIDARRLAEKYDADPDVWDGNVEYYLLQKSKKKFYNDEVVEYGYARGIETVEYVKDILFLYNQYKQFVS